jgi:hypothetical protein
MHRSWNGIRRALGAPVFALVLFASAAAPLLDRVQIDGRPVVESAHDPETCAPNHDHRLCLQVGSNHAFSASESVRSGSPPIRAMALLAPAAARTVPVSAVVHPTRGPPSA